MDGSVGDPVLLRECGWSVDYELFCFFIVSRCSFHLYCIVTVAELSQAKAPSNLELVQQRE